MADDAFVSLYRRFRPGRFSELRGQDHVVRALRNAVRDDRVSHAYLFSGPRGTGKTSSARILAKALNCLAPEDGEPCGRCASCIEIARGTSLDVHELDAASNNGVDAMRDLIAHAALGTPGRWKVYIVDEVHMLSTAAANSLLKTLEEPPGHVVFVLATTDPQKVPATIRSRTQHLEFRLLSADTLTELLQSVRDQVGLSADDDALSASVRLGHGSARDALSALDQIVASGEALSARPVLSDVVRGVSDGDASTMLTALSALTADGWGPQQLATALVDDLRQSFLAVLAPNLCAVTGAEREQYAAVVGAMGLARVVRCIELLGQALVDMRDAPDAQVVLEVALLRAARPDLDQEVSSLSERVRALENALLHAPVAERAPARLEPAPAAPPGSAPPVSVERKPSVGALRRRKAESSGEGTAPVAAPVVADVAEAAPPAVPAPAAPPAAPASPRAAAAVDRDSITEAWGNGVLHNLPARAKALYSAGRFVAVDASGAHFALPTAPHRDRCAEMAPQVEAALSTHFGQPIRLVLTVDDKGDGSAGRAPGPGTSPAPEPDGFSVEDFDDEVVEAAGGDDQVASAHAKLLQAFPGTSEVDS